MFVKVLSWDKTGHSGLTLLRLLVLECTRDCSVPYITLPWEVSITPLPSRPSSQLCLLPRLCFSERWWGDSSPSGKSLTSHCHLVKSTSSVLAVTRVTQLGTPQLLTATARLCFPFSGEVTYSNTAALNIAETLCWLQAIKISPPFSKQIRRQISHLLSAGRAVKWKDKTLSLSLPQKTVIWPPRRCNLPPYHHHSMPWWASWERQLSFDRHPQGCSSPCSWG